MAMFRNGGQDGGPVDTKVLKKGFLILVCRKTKEKILRDDSRVVWVFQCYPGPVYSNLLTTGLLGTVY